MLRMVLGDYRKKWKASFANLKKADPSTVVFIIFAAEAAFSGKILLFAVISLVIGLLLSRMYPNQMSLAELLLPRSEEERKQYVRTGYRLRIGIGICIFVLLEGSQVLLGNLRLIYFCGMLLVEFFLLSAVNLSVPGQVSKQFAYLPVWEMVMQLLAIAGLAMFASAQKNHWLDSAFDGIVMSVMLFLIGLVYAKMMYSYYRLVMEQAVRYTGNTRGEA